MERPERRLHRSTHLVEGDVGAREHVGGCEPAAGAGHGEAGALPGRAAHAHAPQQRIRRLYLAAALRERRPPLLTDLQ